MIPTREEALTLLKEYNTEPFHIKHALTVEGAMRYFATVVPMGTDTVHIVFDEPQRAITPGQAAVLYDGDAVRRRTSYVCTLYRHVRRYQPFAMFAHRRGGGV